MSAESIKAWADLAWPLLAGAILFALLPTIISIARSRGFKIKFGDMELSVEDASKQWQKQIEDLQDQLKALAVPGAAQQSSPGAPSPERTVSDGAWSSDRRPRSILWVDDKPEKNAYEIAKLQKDGYQISTAKSTQAALEFLEKRTELPSMIISDMGRREGLIYQRMAGLDLIREVRSKGIDVPVYVYASSEAARQHAIEVPQAGGNGITASPIELFRFVDEAASRPSSVREPRPARDGA